jgi:hypothetical protein
MNEVIRVLFVSVVLVSCVNNHTNQANVVSLGNEQIQVDSLFCLQEIQKLYHYKSKFITSYSHKAIEVLYRDSLENQWRKIQAHKLELIRFLFKFENKASRLIYGDYKDQGLKITTLSDNLHALYLIECIQRNDYLFNRRFRNYFHPRFFFLNDGLNFIYSVNDSIIPLNDLYEEIDLKQYQGNIEKAWSVVKEYFLNSENYNISEGILGGELKWNTITLSKYGIDSSNFFNAHVKEEPFRTVHFFEFMDTK